MKNQIKIDKKSFEYLKQEAKACNCSIDELLEKMIKIFEEKNQK